MAFFPNSIGLTLFTYFWVTESENHSGFGWKSISWPLQGFENLKICRISYIKRNAKICLSNAIVLKFGQDPHIDKRKRSWHFKQNPMILSTFFGQNAKFDILTGGKISKNSPLKSDFDEICRKRSVYHCDDPVQISRRLHKSNRF